MAKETKLGLPRETKGSFQLKGKVTGVERENFFKEGKTKKGNAYRSIKFGVEVDSGQTFYLDLFGSVLQNVYFSKRVKSKDGKVSYDNKKVEWKSRNSFSREGFQLIGMNLGLEKKSDGSKENDIKRKTDYDGCLYINDHLKDGMNVFVKGKIQYNSYENNSGETVTSAKLIPSQISLCQEVDFSGEGFEPTSNFTQELIFMDIDKESDERFILSAFVVGYNNVEDTTFVVTKSKLASKFRSLKEYTSIEVSGDIVAEKYSDSVEEEAEEDDGWGDDPNPMDRVFASYKREMLVQRAKGASIDNETFTEENVSEAIRKMNQGDEANKEFNSISGDEKDNVDSFDDEGWD